MPTTNRVHFETSSVPSLAIISYKEHASKQHGEVDIPWVLEPDLLLTTLF